METMDFGAALQELKRGSRVARSGWNGKGMWLQLQLPDAHAKMTLPYIFLRTAQGDLVPWVASQTDVLAEDWQVVRVPGRVVLVDREAHDGYQPIAERAPVE